MLIAFTAMFILISGQFLFAQKDAGDSKGWIDRNKNGKRDLYEDPKAAIEDRIADLIGQMTMDEKTCQMGTIYGYKRILKDPAPT